MTSSAAQEPADKEVPTAYVQDMLATDPVHELGLRVTRISSSRLEFVSLSEAKTEMSAPFPVSISGRCSVRSV